MVSINQLVTMVDKKKPFRSHPAEEGDGNKCSSKESDGIEGRDVDGRDVDGRDIEGGDVEGCNVEGRDVEGCDDEAIKFKKIVSSFLY